MAFFYWVGMFIRLVFLLLMWPIFVSAQTERFELDDPRLVNPLPYTVFRPVGVGDEPLHAVLLLHGHGGSEHQWEKGAQAGQRLQRLIDEGKVEPHLLVMPGVGNSWYVSSQAYGKIDQVILDRLMGLVEESHPVKSWAVAGLSMGGYGALRLGFMAPERFKFIAALSPAVFARGDDFSETQYKLFNSAYGTPFSPDDFAQNNPFNMIPKGLPPIYLSVGDDDFFHLEEGTFEIYLALKRAGFRAELRVLNGGHSWGLWQREFETFMQEMPKSAN